MSAAPGYDVAIAGAGLIGLSLALELQSRGARVAVFDVARATRQTSSAAAGMLAADDPHNPPALHPLAQYSLSLYPPFLARIPSLSGLAVPWQTETTIQYLADGRSLRLAERSLDPRQLAASVLAAVRSTSIALHEEVGHVRIHELPDAVRVRPFRGPELFAHRLIHATGAWFHGPPSVTPRKGQMLRVQIPPGLTLTDVHRSETLYIVPRTQGPQAGTAVIGATDEDAGFDLRTHPGDLNRLRSLAAHMVPALADPIASPQVEAWAGLRPGTSDNLPLLGPLPNSSRQWVATGHYRNGILLAPATAMALADALEDKSPAVDLHPFDPARLL
jgi:glycine oxidase